MVNHDLARLTVIMASVPGFEHWFSTPWNRNPEKQAYVLEFLLGTLCIGN